MNFFKEKKVLVTGGTGFIGSHLAEKLASLDADVFATTRDSSLKKFSPLSDKIALFLGDLKDLSFCKKCIQDKDIVFHLASDLGGIEYRKNHPASILHNNLLTSLNVLEASRVNGVERFLTVSSVLAVSVTKTDKFDTYSWSKRTEEILSEAYKREFSLKIIIVRLDNVYGPKDDFNPKSAQVIPSLISRAVDGVDPIQILGTGNEKRSFIFVDDVIDGLLLSIEKGAGKGPIPIGTNEMITIKELAKKIIKLTGKNTKIGFDITKPEGVTFNSVATDEESIGFSPKVDLEEGLKRTIQWYREFYKKS